MRNTAKRILNRWKAEYDFKTYITATGSFAVTLFFAFYSLGAGKLRELACVDESALFFDSKKNICSMFFLTNT